MPQELKQLYKHWPAHTKQDQTKTYIRLPNQLEYFVSERMLIWEQKQNGLLKPYTKDEILQKYRFCNIYRELDKQTIEIHTSLKPFQNNLPLWLLNVAFHRFVCNPSTIKKVGMLSFNMLNNKNVFNKLSTLDKPKYGTPYIFPISVIQKSEHPTREEFVCFYLPKTIPLVAKKLESFKKVTVNNALQILLPTFGFNFKFHWTEILIDVHYQFPHLIDLSKDFYVGPGALPTAKSINNNLPPTQVVDECVKHKIKNFPYLTYNNKPIQLSAENWEGIFCEFRKYTNLKNGTGRKRLYKTS